ncbi:RNA ligase/cyclic nucleotide phosphodiesterase [Aspergillus egyptiacus]|nr:RNA ligase/cyclic nucleotide phosphodiesterase [Aspergillus egyptiacus]
MPSQTIPPKTAKKFHPDGTPKQYRGHSVICPLPASSTFRPTLRRIQASLRAHPLSSTLYPGAALLPESSWHTTVFIGIRDRERAEAVMPRGGYAEDLKRASGLQGPYEEWLAYMTSRVRGMEVDPGARPPYRLEILRTIPEIKYSISIRLRQRDDGDDGNGGSLVRLRDQLSEKTGIRHENHEGFRFHITLAYMLREVSGEEATELKRVVEGVLQSDAPEDVVFDEVSLCSFETMGGFEVVLRLGDGGSGIDSLNAIDRGERVNPR